jgi:hypothetical protein
MERRYLSLTGCYTVLTVLGMLILTYAYPVLLDDRLDGSGAIESMRAAALVFRERMHGTWFFFVVFAAVWLVVLLWMLMERRGRQLPFNRQEVYWMGWMSLSVFSAAVLYGMGTNGILARRFPRSVMVSDVVAMGFMLALPVVAWSRLQRQQKEVEAVRNSVEEIVPSYRTGGILGLNEGSPDARLVERRAAWQEAALAAEQKPSMAVVASAESPVMEARGVEQPVPVSSIAAETTSNSVAGFREHLSALNESWQRIEQIGQEIEQWFDEQRRQAIAQLELHPGLRRSGSLSSDFPAQKLAAVDAEWAQIRSASQALNRWLEERS